MAKLRIRQVRSAIGYPKRTKATLRALGIKRINHEVVQEDNPAIRGMIARVRHIVKVEDK